MKAHWVRLQPRERRLLAAAALVIAGVLLWTLVWEPIHEARETAYRQAAEQRALLDWLDRLAPVVARLRASDRPGRIADDRSTLSIIDNSARMAGLAGAMRRIEPADEDEVRVDFEGAEFPALMRWLAQLSAERPLQVVRFSADRVDAGRVDSTVLLRRLDGAADD